MNAQPERDLVDFAEITEIELRVLRRMKEYTLGDHGSVFHGTGVDFVGLRDWQAGDRMSSIDWPQSTPDELHADGGSRVRAAGHGADRRRGRSIAVDAVRNRRRADRGRHRARDRHDRPVGGVLPGHVRADHVRQRLREHGVAAPARRPGPRDSLPRRVSGPRGDGGRRERAAPGHDHRRPLAPHDAGAGDFGFSVRGRGAMRFASCRT